jgi:hypothetical protein
LTPQGYLLLTYGAKDDPDAAALELAYNRVERVLALRPLNQSAVETAAALPLVNKKVVAAYRESVGAFSHAADLGEQHELNVRIAQDNLVRAKELERELAQFTPPLSAAAGHPFAIAFDLYTLELYRKALSTEGSIYAPAECTHMMKSLGGQVNGAEGLWCW